MRTCIGKLIRVYGLSITNNIIITTTFGAYDYAGQYEPDATYELKGADSDIRSLDVAKAVSDMQKDELIHQYQYFVGQDLGTNTPATPSIRGAEDFSL